MADLTLGEFLAQAQRSMGGGAYGRTNGPMSSNLFGPDFMKKSNTYTAISDTFNYTYGKKVWDALNNKTVTFNAIKKVDWGPTVGWRLRSTRGSARTQPVSETGALPGAATMSTYVGVYGYPKQIVSYFGTNLKAQAVAALEGGIGNQFAVEQEAVSRDHIKEINLELMSATALPVQTGGSATLFTIGADTASNLTGYNSLHVGDTIGFWDVSAVATDEVQGGVVSSTTPPTTAGVVTVSALDTTLAAGDVIYILSRNGLTSIDDVVAADAMTAGGYFAYSNAYNLTTRTAATYAAAAKAAYNSGVGRDLKLSDVDSLFQTIRQNGGDPKLIVTGLDQYDRLNQLLQAQQRFVDVTDYVVGAGDERTYPGTRAGFQLATYRGVPILPDPDCPKSQTAGTYTNLGSNFYALDTDYLEIPVMYPTQYVENRDYLAANALVIRGLFISMMELRALRFDVHAKLGDLNA
jgi:hypothetical protein